MEVEQAATLPQVANGGDFPRGRDDDLPVTAAAAVTSDRRTRQTGTKRSKRASTSVIRKPQKINLSPLVRSERAKVPSWLQVGDLQPGTLLLGCVVTVRPERAVILLPYGIWGTCPLAGTEALERSASGAPTASVAVAATLKLQPQTIVRACVLSRPLASHELEPERRATHQSGKRERSIHLSVDPRHVNRGLGLSERLADYGPIQVRLSLPLDDAQKRFTVEALAEDPSQDRRLALQVSGAGATASNDTGMVCWASLASWNEQRRTGILQNDPKMVAEAFTRGHWTLEQLSPGMLVEAQVLSRDERFAIVRFLQVFEGILEWFHLDQWEDFARLEPDAILRVRLIYIDCRHRRIMVTARTSLVNTLTLPLLVSAARRYHRGSFVESLRVFKIENGRGIWLRKDKEAIYFFADRKMLSDERFSRMERLFPLGTVVPRARVVSHMAMEGIVRVSLKPSLLERKFMDVSELEPGALVRCRVLGWISVTPATATPSLRVSIEDCLSGEIPLELLTDVPVQWRRLEKKFPPGSQLRCRVWLVYPKRKQVLLTARRSLVDSDLPILAGWDTMQQGQVYAGILGPRDPSGAYRVLFYQRFTGILPANLGTEMASLKSGQVIRVRVERIHSRRAKQLLVSLDNSAVTATPMAAAAAAAAAASEQQSDQGRLRPGTLVRIQSAFRDQVGRILALVYIDEPRAKDAGAQSAKRTWLVLLPRQHLTDYPMFQKSWAADAGLAALFDEVALVIDAGHTGDSSLPLISHRWSLCRAAACGLLDDGAGERSAPGSIGVGYVERIGAAQAYAVVRLGLSSRRVHVQRALLADRFVDQSTSVLLEGQLVLYSVRNGSRYSLRYSDVQPALETEPYREFFQEMRSLVPLVRELARLWRAHEASQSLGLSLPLPGTLVRGRVLYSSDDRMDMEVQHEQVIYRGVVGSYHFVDTQAGEQAPTASRETSTTRAAVGQLCTALVLWMDPLAKTMVLSRKASLLKTAPLPWSDAQCLTATDSTVSSSLGGCTRVQKAQVLAVYGQVAVLLAQARLAFMSTLDINGRGTERPVHVGQQLTVTARTANATARPPPAPAASTPAADDENNGAKNGDDAAEWPAWMRAMLRASVRPAAPSTETAAQSAGVQTKRQVPQPLSRPPVRIGDVVTDAEVTAVHSFQVHVRWSDGQTGRVHIINVENEGAFRELQVGHLLPPARIVAQRRPRQWELSLRQRDLEATDVLSLDSLPQTGDLVERAVVKTTDLNAQGDVLAVWLYVRPGLVARLSRLEATPRVLDESWVPGRFVQGLRVLRADADRKRYDLTTTDPLLAGQCITGARVRSVHPVDGIVRVQLPRGQMGVLFIGCLPYEDPKDPFRTLQGIQKLDVYLVEDWIPSKQVPVTAIPERQPLRWAQLHRGDVVGAFVRHVDQAGVFLNLAPGLVARCLLRDLAEGFVPDPVQVYPVGMHVQAMITDCGGSDARHVRVSLRAAQQQQQQQQQRAVAAEQAPTSAVHIGGVYLGRVRRVVPFGIFVELLTDRTDEGDAQVLATALCHRSELVEQGPWPLPEELPQRFRVGQHLPVLVVARDAAGRLSLSAKASLIKEALATQCASAKPIDEVDLGAGFTPALKDVIVSATEDENVAHEPISRSGNCDSPASAATKYAASSLMGSERSPQQKDPMACLGSNTTALDHLEENTETEEMEHTAHHPNGIYAAVNGASAGTLPFLAIPSETELVREDADTHASKDWSRSVDEASGAARAPLDDEALERGERALVESLHKPQTAADFERALLGRPNDPQLWIGYMALHLATGNELEARGIAERALQTIHYREYQARMRVWIAYLNLERSANAAADPLESDIFRRALQNCDSLQLHLRLARSLEAAQEVKLAGRVYEHACRRHGHQTASVWIAYGAFCFLRSSQEVLGRTLLERALRALMDPAQHVQCILKFATFEFKGSGEPERGRTLLENLIQAFPKRLDFWNVYLDMELMLLRQERGKLELVRRLFRRCTALPNLSLKQAKHFFKRYLEVERAFGDASSVEHVKQAARAYVAQRTGEAPQR